MSKEKDKINNLLKEINKLRKEIQNIKIYCDHDFERFTCTGTGAYYVCKKCNTEK